MLQSQEGRKFFFTSSWLSEDKSVAALKEQLGVAELPVEMVETVEEQAALVSRLPQSDPVTIQVGFSRRAFWTLVAINVVGTLVGAGVFRLL